jgi:hypothetical protein
MPTVQTPLSEKIKDYFAYLSKQLYHLGILPIFGVP